MAQSRRRRSRSSARARPSLDEEKLQELALWYVGRYATSKAKLCRYLNRKIHERGWEGESDPDCEALACRFEELGYIDDSGFAASRASSLVARGYGIRRVTQDLYAAGISEEDRAKALRIAESRTFESAVKFARKRRFGPFAAGEMDAKARQKAIAAMMRAGHSYDIARKIIDCDDIDLLIDGEV